MRPASAPTVRFGLLGSLLPLNVFGLGTLFTRDEIKHDFLALMQGLESIPKNVGVMHKHILPFILRDEPKAAFIVPPLYLATGHRLI